MTRLHFMQLLGYASEEGASQILTVLSSDANASRAESCEKGDREDHTAMALESLQAGTPFISHSRLYCDQLRLFLLKKTPY